MQKIGIIGNDNEIGAYYAVGVEKYNPIYHDSYAAIFIMENVANDYKDLIEECRNKILPSVVLLPIEQGESRGMKEINKSVIRAIGAEII